MTATPDCATKCLPRAVKGLVLDLVLAPGQLCSRKLAALGIQGHHSRTLMGPASEAVGGKLFHKAFIHSTNVYCSLLLPGLCARQRGSTRHINTNRWALKGKMCQGWGLIKESRQAHSVSPHPVLSSLPVCGGHVLGTHGAEHEAAEPVAQAQAAHQPQAGQLAAGAAPGVAVAQLPHGQRAGQLRRARAALVLRGLWLHGRCGRQRRGPGLRRGSAARPPAHLRITPHSPRSAAPTSSAKASRERPAGRRARPPSAPGPRAALRRPMAGSGTPCTHRVAAPPAAKLRAAPLPVPAPT